MLKQVVLVSVLHLGIIVTITPYSHSTMKPCPSFKSKSNFTINQMMGEWNLAMLLTDEPQEYEYDSSCMKGNFKKINNTAFRQVWYINSPQHEYGITMDLPTIITHTGDWTVTDPLGGHLQVKIAHASPMSHLSMTFCGMQHGKSVHLWTAVITRTTPGTNIDFLKLYAELLAHSISTDNSNIIMLDKC